MIAAANVLALVGATVLFVLAFAAGIGAMFWVDRRYGPGLYDKRPDMSRWESYRANSRERAENPPAYFRVLYPLMGVGFTIFAGARRGWPMLIVAAVVMIPFFTVLGFRLAQLSRWNRAHPIVAALVFAPVQFVFIATIFGSLALWWCAVGAVALTAVTCVIGLRQGPRPNLSGGA